jgi:methyl-accepting chemotaxis protein-1 (serine sensor receptor)
MRIQGASMQFIAHFPIGKRLGTTFAILVLVLAAVAAIAVRSAEAADERFSRYVKGINARAGVAAQLRTAVDVRAISARNLVLVEKAEDLAAEKAAVAKAHAEVGERLAQLKKMLADDATASPRARALVEEIDKVEHHYEPVALRIVGLIQDGRKAQAIAEMNEKCRPLLAALTRATDEYAEFSRKAAQEQTEASAASFSRDETLLVVVSIAAALLAALAGWLVTRSITVPIARAVQVAETVAAGDLRSDIVARGKDETAQLLQALSKMNANLVALVAQVREGSDGIATGTGEIATGNQDLSRRTEQQASSLQQTAASMQQLTATVRSNSATAQQATKLAGSASSVAEQGGEAVRQVVGTMNEISQASRKIADIIGVIDGIAFQTNILALNAAVEAARAGEQGRGFAVVAGEVRSLAQRCADAAKEIRALITDSTAKVSAGSEQVEHAGQTMGEIVSQVQRVRELVGRISSASSEQTEGIGQVGEAVTRLDEVTQQNAALVEQSAAAASSLNQQAARLVTAVSVFKVPGGQFAAA